MVSTVDRIAERAGVPVEGVLRVLTRRPVSEAIEQRVLEAVAELEPAEQELVQRMATITRPVVEDGAEAEGGEAAVDLATVDFLRDRLHELIDASAVALERRSDGDRPEGQPNGDAAFSEAVRHLATALSGLARSVEELRRDGDSDRAARVEDLALLVDLVVTGWHTVDRRLGRLERMVQRSAHPKA